MESEKIIFLHFKLGTTNYDFCVRYEVLMALTMKIICWDVMPFFW